ncbi:MAG: sigma-70 family RNA polymerase sigma factor [Planctomycetota bacterium]
MRAPEHDRGHSLSDSAEAAFVSQLTECQIALQLYIRSLLMGDPASADVAQQANAKIWEKRADFEPGTNFKAWAMTIARYEVLSFRKRQARDARLCFSDELETTFADEIAELDDDLSKRQAALQHCLEGLSPGNRELLMRRYASPETLSQVARQLGRPVGSLKVSLHRLRSTLAACIERRLANLGDSI